MSRRPPSSPLFPYTTLFRSRGVLPRGLSSRPRRARGGRRGLEHRHLGALLPHALPERPLPPLRAGATERRPAQEEPRSEEHTSELQSHHDLVCRLLLEKKKK